VLQGWLNAATGAKDVASLDKAYQASTVLKKAAERAAAQGGVFSPYQLLKASRPGTDLNQLARDAQAVMGNNLPNSGTADRGVAAYMLANPTKALASLAGMIPAGLLYSRPVQKFIVGPSLSSQAYPGALMPLLGRPGALYQDQEQ
jgi:hypothetical protein